MSTKNEYLENWERLAGILITLGLVALTVVMQRNPINWILASLATIPGIIGALLMWRVKAAQKVAKRSSENVDVPPQ